MDVANFLDKHGRIKCWPAKREAKLIVLRHLGSKFLPGRFYTEKEVNRIIEEHHAFGDYFLLRRELVDRGIMVRTPDGAKYWLNPDSTEPEAGAAENAPEHAGAGGAL